MTPLEFIAHDIICIVKFNAVGGTATRNEIKRVTEYLSRLGKLPAPELPKFTLPEVAQAFGVPLSVVLPTVRIPGRNPPPPVGVIRPTPPPNPPAVRIAAPPAVVVVLPPK
jgi:hypothetical protein